MAQLAVTLPATYPQETRMSILDIQIEPKKKAATLVAALRLTVK